jgi:hypothetical protein
LKYKLTSEILADYADRKRAFNSAFAMVPHGPKVMELMEEFCHARTTTFAFASHDLSMILEGRRQVYLMIRDYLDLAPEQLIPKYTEVPKPE